MMTACTGMFCNIIQRNTLQKKSTGTLDEIFGERVTCRGVWPPRSPNLLHYDFSVWGGHADIKSVCDQSAIFGRTSRK
jgi:hypothetical protein